MTSIQVQCRDRYAQYSKNTDRTECRVQSRNMAIFCSNNKITFKFNQESKHIIIYKVSSVSWYLCASRWQLAKQQIEMFLVA